MSDPVLVEVTRGDAVESLHRGAFSVFDFSGKPVLEMGDTDRPVFPRSAVKAIQALPLIETGAADALDFSDMELAMAQSSHNGEPEHTQAANSMLQRAGYTEADLECGSHWPTFEKATLDLARQGGTPNQLHNNCSGKHAGFLSVCRHCGMNHHGYVAEAHPFQEMVRQTMQDVTGAVHEPENRAIDGCSIPTYAVPLKALALGFARMGGGKGFEAGRAKAATRLLDAAMRNPFHIAGTGRADTKIMQAAPGRVFVKTGAEGVFCGVVAERELAFAIKCDDGANRGSETVVAGLLARIFAGDSELGPAMSALARRNILTRKSAVVGEVRPAQALRELSI